MLGVRWFKNSTTSPLFTLHVPSVGEHDTYKEKLTTGITGSSKFSPTQLRIIWTFSSMVLKRNGIHPMWTGSNSKEILDMWQGYKVDPAQQLTCLQYQRMLLISLVSNGEQFERIVQGKLMPLPLVTEIKYDRDTGMPIEYIWKNHNGTPNENFTLQPSEVRHIFIPLYPGQRRGTCLYNIIKDMAVEKEEYIKSVSAFAKHAAKMWMVLKRTGAGGVTDKKQENKIDLGKQGTLELNANQDMEIRSAGSVPVDPLAIDRVTSGIIGNAYGISRMQASGDYSDVNYSSARFAAIVDSGIWSMYQEVVLDSTRSIYEQWPGRPAYAAQFNGWYRPPFASVDPVKTAAADRIYAELGAKSIQQIITEQDLDVEQTFTEMEEYNKRFSTTNGGVNEND